MLWNEFTLHRRSRKFLGIPMLLCMYVYYNKKLNYDIDEDITESSFFSQPLLFTELSNSCSFMLK